MTLTSWWPRRRHQALAPVLDHRPSEPAVADVVHQLQDLSWQLREQVTRLEHANDRVEQSTKPAKGAGS